MSEIKFGQVSYEDYPEVVSDFATNLMNDKFIGNECENCGIKYFPPVKACENFHDAMRDFEVNTDAILKGFTVIHFAPDSHNNLAPYVVAIGELGEGISVMAHLVGITSMPKVGMRIKLKSQKISEDRVVYKFTPV